MLALLLTIRLRAQWCNSLKDKRSAVKRLLSGLRGTFNVSACESGEQDEHRLIELTVCALAFDRAQGDAIASEIERFVSGHTDAEILRTEAEYR